MYAVWPKRDHIAHNITLNNELRMFETACDAQAGPNIRSSRNALHQFFFLSLSLS